jgi:chromosome transmission fidelity protein 1
MESAREAAGIRLKDSIIIVDEAHNLIDAINSLHSIVFDEHRVGCNVNSEKAFEQLTGYFEKYKNRFNSNNTMYIKQILFILNLFKKFFKDAQACMIPVNTFVTKIGIDHLNLYKLLAFMKKSKLAIKLKGFAEKKPAAGHTSTNLDPLVSSHEYTLGVFESFIHSLSHPDVDGRILVSTQGIVFINPGTSKFVQYLLLNPSEVFRPIVSEARSVILAGGTMQPYSDFYEQLFPFVEAKNISLFSCGHVIPKDQMLPICLSSGPNGQVFNYSSRIGKTLQ